MTIQIPASLLLTPSSVFAIINKQSGPVINGLGDSITAFSSYSPYGTSLSNVPQWAASSAYSVGNMVQNNGLPYRCTTAGTSAASGGPTTTNQSVTDNTVVWAYVYPVTLKSASSYLFWTETFSLGRVNWDMSKGYGGFPNALLKVIVVSGGTGYSAGDTVTFNNGATGTLTIAGGVITGCSVTNPGFNNGAISSGFTYTITTSTGSGAVLSTVQGGTGTFGVPGCKTADMVARLPDVLASDIDVCVVLGGTNDISNSVGFSTITANLKTCYETLMAAGIKVIAVPVTPRTGLSAAQIIVYEQVNEWIRNYCRKASTSNPSGYTFIALADVSRYWADGTSTGIDPIGGASAGANAMTQDGLHPSPRGGGYLGIAILQAMEQFINGVPTSESRAASMANGFDLTSNPYGNMVEAYPWQPSTAYVTGQTCMNNANVYRCKSNGTSASSGGPSGTGSTISDGSTSWAYVRPQGCSVAASGSSGTFTAATGITYSGSLPTGFTLSRASGTATGTVTGAIENPWSDGQVGNRLTLAFNLASGGQTEFWQLAFTTPGAAAFGLLSSDEGVGLYYMDVEIEISAVQSVTHVDAFLSDGNLTTQAYASHAGYFHTQGSSSALNMMNSTSEMLPIPNNGKMVLRSQPIAIPSNLNSFTPTITFSFNATTSATLTAKINYFALKRAF